MRKLWSILNIVLILVIAVFVENLLAKYNFANKDKEHFKENNIEVTDNLKNDKDTGNREIKDTEVIKDLGQPITNNTDISSMSHEDAQLLMTFANGINIGGISMGIVDFKREKNITIIKFIFRCINEDWFPKSFSIEITDDRENKYSAMVYHYPFNPMPLVGSTWITNFPVVIKIPKIAPIYKFEILPAINDAPDELKNSIPKNFSFDYRKYVPFPHNGISLKFKNNTDEILAGKEIAKDKDLTISLGETKIEEKVETKDNYNGVKNLFKIARVNIPVIIENQDYNSHVGRIEFYLRIQFNSGKFCQDNYKLVVEGNVEGLSKKTFNYVFDVKMEEYEHIQFILAYADKISTFTPESYVFSDMFRGFLYVSEKSITPLQANLPNPPPRKPTPLNIEDGDWFTDGSKIVLSEKKEIIKEFFGTKSIIKIYRIFTMNPDGTNKQEIELKLDQKTNNEIMSEEHVAPLISPDGQKIAFVVGRYDHDLFIYTMDIDGNNIQRIAGGFSSLAYSWLSNDEIALWGSSYSYGHSLDIDIFYTSNESYFYIIDLKNKIMHRTIDPLEALQCGKIVTHSGQEIITKDLLKNN